MIIDFNREEWIKILDSLVIVYQGSAIDDLDAVQHLIDRIESRLGL